MAVQVDFYQLGHAPASAVLRRIAVRVLDGGGRLLVLAADGDRATALDDGLWEGEDSFLPHGRATADDPGADQPILIADTCIAANGARHVAIADGVWRDDVLGFDRVFHLFDAGTIDAARVAWRGLGAVPDCIRNFWSQDEAGRWTRVA